MDRILRLGGGMPGLSQGPPPSDAPVVDTAEQVWKVHENACIYIPIQNKQCLLTGIHIILGSLENA